MSQVSENEHNNIVIINRYNDRQFKQSDESPSTFGHVENCAVIQGNPRPNAQQETPLQNMNSPDSIFVSGNFVSGSGNFVSGNDGFFDGSSQKYLVDYFCDMTSMNLSSGDKVKAQATRQS